MRQRSGHRWILLTRLGLTWSRERWSGPKTDYCTGSIGTGSIGTARRRLADWETGVTGLGQPVLPLSVLYRLVSKRVEGGTRLQYRGYCTVWTVGLCFLSHGASAVKKR